MQMIGPEHWVDQAKRTTIMVEVSTEGEESQDIVQGYFRQPLMNSSRCFYCKYHSSILFNPI